MFVSMGCTALPKTACGHGMPVLQVSQSDISSIFLALMNPVSPAGDESHPQL